MRWIGVAASLVLAVSLLAFAGRWILKNYDQAGIMPCQHRLQGWSRRWFHGIRGLTAMSESLSLRGRRPKFKPNAGGGGAAGPCHLSGHPDTNLAGEVAMKVVIATDGRVKEIHVLSGNRILAEAAVQPYGSGTTLNMH